MPLLIEKQRALCRIGKIRMGSRKMPNRPGPQRSTFRFTSANKAALEALQKVYDGKVIKFDTNPGEWELDSTSGQIQVVIDTAHSADENYLLQDGKTTTHKCDGVNCAFFEIKRDREGKITHSEDHGIVPCRCDREYADAYINREELPEPVEDSKRLCSLITTLRVMLPATGDVVLWEFASKGSIFNKEMIGTIDTLREMGVKQLYCHLTINLLEKHRGKDVSKFGVARLTVDPNPPNFAKAMLANTPAAQALEIQQQALPGRSSGPSAPAAPDKDRVKKAHALTKDQGQELVTKLVPLGLRIAEFCSDAFDDGEIGFAALLGRVARLSESKTEVVEAEIVEEEKTQPEDPFADVDQPNLIGGS